MKLMKYRYLLLSGAVALGCSSAPLDGPANGADDSAQKTAAEVKPDAAKPTLSVTLTNGNTFEVYEPVPGDILYSETGKQGTPRTDIQSIRKSTVRAVLESLPLAEPVPALVDELDQRQIAFRKVSDGLHRATRASVNAETTTKLAPSTSAFAPKMSASAFQTQFCSSHTPEDGSCNEFIKNCWPNSTGDYTYYAGDVNVGYVAVNAWSGTVTLRYRYRPWYTWYTMGQWDVPSDTWRWASRVSSCSSNGPEPICYCDDWDFEAAIFNASGAGYHLSTQWDGWD